MGLFDSLLYRRYHILECLGYQVGYTGSEEDYRKDGRESPMVDEMLEFKDFASTDSYTTLILGLPDDQGRGKLYTYEEMQLHDRRRDYRESNEADDGADDGANDGAINGIFKSNRQ